MIEPVLEICWTKLMEPETQSPTLIRCLLNVFLAATLQDIDKTLKFLESKNEVVSFLSEFVDAGQFKEDD